MCVQEQHIHFESSKNFLLLCFIFIHLNAIMAHEYAMGASEVYVCASYCYNSSLHNQRKANGEQWSTSEFLRKEKSRPESDNGAPVGICLFFFFSLRLWNSTCSTTSVLAIRWPPFFLLIFLSNWHLQMLLNPNNLFWWTCIFAGDAMNEWNVSSIKWVTRTKHAHAQFQVNPSLVACIATQKGIPNVCAMLGWDWVDNPFRKGTFDFGLILRKVDVAKE